MGFQALVGENVIDFKIQKIQQDKSVIDYRGRVSQKLIMPGQFVAKKTGDLLYIIEILPKKINQYRFKFDGKKYAGKVNELGTNNYLEAILIPLNPDMKTTNRYNLA